METESKLFPSPANRRDRCLHSYEIENKIKSAIIDDGYRGYVSMMAYVGDDDWEKQFLDTSILIINYPIGDKHTGFHFILADIIFWTMIRMDGKDDPGNVLILSNKYKDMEEDKWFTSLRNFLENKRFYVVLAQPEKLINLDGIDQIRRAEEEAQNVSFVPIGGFTEGRSSKDVSEKPYDSTITEPYSTIWD